ncbi:hypothetical protein ANN_20625 [Periplaneta americana]|uniref:Uncharacterized protein n=1 Tax=Periplaneta americana TaxID=6978 RepID=A0ABQ8SD36_PERAM|nr:hypothetical protein ANN_20625 [Periplaneta americana]
MSPGSNTESYPPFDHIGLRENPGKNLNQVTWSSRESNPGHLVSRPDALAVTPQYDIESVLGGHKFVSRTPIYYSIKRMLRVISPLNIKTIIIIIIINFPCIVGPYHHGMARPQVTDRGDGLQIWRVAVNILNRQSETADEGWSSSLGVGRRANNPLP